MVPLLSMGNICVCTSYPTHHFADMFLKMYGSSKHNGLLCIYVYQNLVNELINAISILLVVSLSVLR